MKYQFCIRFEDTTVNSAATKAVLDCNTIFAEHGYHDYTFTVNNNADKIKYYTLLLKELTRFYFGIKRNSIVGIQYPLLSINNVFRYFINVAKLKGIKFYCIIHDLESLRTGGRDQDLIKLEIHNLNQFDVVIAHNPAMINWLRENGLHQKTVSLGLFDYLSPGTVTAARPYEKAIAFAGNLSKSAFIYAAGAIKEWSFNVYGPFFNKDKSNRVGNLHWCGEFSTQEIVHKLHGSFGLIWDGEHIDRCDEVLGNYLKYNNPHKFSLYLAAGLPVIAPKNSAIGSFIAKNNIGILINGLPDIENIKTDAASYAVMKRNVLKIREKVINGGYFSEAIKTAEGLIGNQN